MISGSRNSGSIKSTFGVLLAAALGCAIASSCNDGGLKDVRKLSAKEIEESTERSEGVEIIYSDSAKVKARLTSPLWLHHLGANPWSEWPNGVLVVFYDEQQREQNRVRADYATRKDNERIVELRKNVVITTAAGDTYKSDQMFWNDATRKFYSDKLLTRISKKGETGYATSFESDENFLHPVFHGASGDILVPESTTNP